MDRTPLPAVPAPRIGVLPAARRRLLRGILWGYRGLDWLLGGRRDPPAARAKARAEAAAEPDAAIGPMLGREDAPLLFKLLEHLDHRMGGVFPGEVRLGYLPACGVLDLGGPAGKPRQVLIVGYPCLQVWTVDEFSSVLAHELAHLKLDDAAFTRAVLQAAQGLQQAGAQSRGPRRWAAAILGRSLVCAAADVCRRMEFRADAWSAECFRPEPLAEALEKLLLAQPLFREIVGSYDAAERPGDTVYASFGRLWDGLPAVSRSSLRDRLLTDVKPVPTDPHPSLLERLERLRRNGPKRNGLPKSAGAVRLLADPAMFERLLHNRLFGARRQRAAVNSVFFAEEDG